MEVVLLQQALLWSAFNYLYFQLSIVSVLFQECFQLPLFPVIYCFSPEAADNANTFSFSVNGSHGSCTSDTFRHLSQSLRTCSSLWVVVSDCHQSHPQSLPSPRAGAPLYDSEETSNQDCQKEN